MKYVIYKLEEPRLQVGMPNTHKWAVGKEQVHGIEFVDAFKTRRGAREFITGQGHCVLCGEKIDHTRHPTCGCERAALHSV
jgi:hypothetical protein